MNVEEKEKDSFFFLFFQPQSYILNELTKNPLSMVCGWREKERERERESEREREAILFFFENVRFCPKKFFFHP